MQICKCYNFNQLRNASKQPTPQSTDRDSEFLIRIKLDITIKYNKNQYVL